MDFDNFLGFGRIPPRPVGNLIVAVYLMKKLLLSSWFMGAIAWMATLSAPAQDLGGDLSLGKLLIDGENWEIAVEGLGFADGPCADAAGNFYCSDMRKGTDGPGIFRVSLDGTRKKLFAEAASGLMFGPDGRLYACQGRDKRIVAFDLKSGEREVVASDVQPNDLVVSHRGHIYFTETRAKQITFVDLKSGEKRVADVGITAPNGIALSADGGTLAVSDFRGRHVWVFRVDEDGSLSAKAPFMSMRTKVDPKQPHVPVPVLMPSCRGDGMTSDLSGRWYVATELGVQFFDPSGRISGVIPAPAGKGMTSVALAGEGRSWLYITCGDTIYRRRVKATGALYFTGLNR
jgi:sugar lactone lactonase YvrE